MQLIFDRKQSSATFNLIPFRIGGGVLFTLWGKIELDEEEKHLLRRYRFSDAYLIEDDWFETLKRSMKVAILAAGFLFFVSAIFFGWALAGMLAFLLFCAITAVYYHKTREHIYVRDLVNGRHFYCYSIIALVRREAQLETMCAFLRQVLESAKHWGEREVIELAPLPKEEAKRLLVRGLGQRVAAIE